jgi:hypothetical protein
MTRTAFEDRITADLRRLAEFAPDDTEEPLPLVEAREVRTPRRRRMSTTFCFAVTLPSIRFSMPWSFGFGRT